MLDRGFPTERTLMIPGLGVDGSDQDQFKNSNATRTLVPQWRYDNLCGSGEHLEVVDDRGRYCTKIPFEACSIFRPGNSCPDYYLMPEKVPVTGFELDTAGKVQHAFANFDLKSGMGFSQDLWEELAVAASVQLIRRRVAGKNLGYGFNGQTGHRYDDEKFNAVMRSATVQKGTDIVAEYLNVLPIGEQATPERKVAMFNRWLDAFISMNGNGTGEVIEFPTDRARELLKVVGLNETLTERQLAIICKYNEGFAKTMKDVLHAMVIAESLLRAQGSTPLQQLTSIAIVGTGRQYLKIMVREIREMAEFIGDDPDDRGLLSWAQNARDRIWGRPYEGSLFKIPKRFKEITDPDPNLDTDLVQLLVKEK
ncbi:MAG TPA: hypothetical protein PK957_04465 [Candidatus Dojkabacteria bacterium]|nr:hypothetical protein [Candidatus Dojkabacteria bacterium]HQF36982.1 hypothetical protein [Candidatus Dojkabacteria bacterium]